MANERTEAATPKRRNQARQKGQISKSQDFNSAVMLAVGLSLIYVFIPSMVTKFKSVTIEVFSNLDPNRIELGNFIGFFKPYGYLVFDILTPILLTLMFGGIVLNYVQIGPLFATQSVKPDFSKLSPMNMINGFKKFVSPKSLVELLKSLVKMAIVAWVAYAVIISRKQEVLSLLGADIQLSLSTISSIIFQMAMQICIILILLGIADKKYQDFQFEKSIKMTKEEVKDEAKNAQGDPKIKAKIKSVQMQYAMQRMMGSIPTADVIVTNPTHFAVALRYDTNIAPAPQVIAKGVDFVAFKIKEIAKNNNIPIVENKPLARTLYKIVPLDGLIPADLYVAVAEVLAYVFKLNNKGKVR